MTEAVLEAPAENESLFTVETAHLVTEYAARAECLAAQLCAAGIEPEDNE